MGCLVCPCSAVTKIILSSALHLLDRTKVLYVCAVCVCVCVCVCVWCVHVCVCIEQACLVI